jgi:heterodisulfide reductase subunit C
MSEPHTAGTVTPTPGLAEAILQRFDVDVNACYQCGKCAAGCPVGYAMDYAPAQLIHAARLGMDDLVLRSKTIWLCAACETCTTRCPQDVEIAKVMDAAKIIAANRGIDPALASVRAFHSAALSSVRHLGRIWEIGLFVSLKLRTGEYMKDAGLAKRMLRKGKLKFLPTFTGARRARRIFSRVREAERDGGNSS